MIERLRVGPIGENAYVLHLDEAAALPGAAGKPCALVDPGDEAARLLSFLDDRGFVPSLIVATHGHLDHTAAIPELLAAYAARGLRPRLAVHPGDAAYFGERGEETNRRLFAAIRALGYFKSYFRPLPDPDLLLEEGDLLPGSSWRVIHVPGHTAGSICLHEASAGLLLTGDCLFRDGIGRTDGPDSDGELLHEGLMRKIFTLPGETRVFPGHGEPTSLGRERGESVD